MCSGYSYCRPLTGCYTTRGLSTSSAYRTGTGSNLTTSRRYDYSSSSHRLVPSLASTRELQLALNPLNGHKDGRGGGVLLNGGGASCLYGTDDHRLMTSLGAGPITSSSYSSAGGGGGVGSGHYRTTKTTTSSSSVMRSSVYGNRKWKNQQLKIVCCNRDEISFCLYQNIFWLWSVNRMELVYPSFITKLCCHSYFLLFYLTLCCLIFWF